MKNERLIITNEYNCYGGDNDRILFLEANIKGRSVNLGMECDKGVVSIHLTSDEDYIKWLGEHYKSLLLIGEEYWHKKMNLLNVIDIMESL